MTEIFEPQDCTTMAEVRAGVDDVDRKIVALLARRFGYMDAAARIKPDRAVVRDEARKAEVIAKVKTSAREHRLDPDLLACLYDQLIEACIAYEFEEFDRLRA
jgi:isochorismate pyruvate lyase